MAGECIMCGKCLAVCPLLQATGREELSPRAKSTVCQLLSDDPKALSEADVATLAGMCLGCGRCREVCSQGVDVPTLVAGLRAAHPDFKAWLWKTWLIHARQMWVPGSRAARCLPESLVPAKFGAMLRMLTGLTGESGVTPCLKVTSFPETYRGHKMLFFAGCTANYAQPRWRTTTLRLLDGLGVEVLPDDFTCCGSGLKTAGFDGDSRTMAAHNVQVWRDAGRPPVVTLCASCRAGLLGYDGCFESVEEQDNWMNMQFPVSSLLHGASFVLSHNVPETLAYHQPCHARGDDADGLLLGRIFSDHGLQTSGGQCCGFGGIMRLAAPELTEPVNRLCWDALAGSEVVVTGCSACVTQLAATAPESVAVGHWLELLE
ncbi:4Fe-4S dicluster domain-containing protein [Pseudodesulfovibrio sp. JC047]|uniref:(Fe-S)-binding protein n=1 Tax=Pseudodesulfovibrio sp. JC047 TaxID=2683199 RepID=UPI0013D81D9C|nr:(Fe-S)-binding protein [Pseudodesulfovibrio sp. JC047]NDV20453.1 4Fe-4S dicluster domain-containing protein [Pseudodesulfovibrio sp. JC047]